MNNTKITEEELRIYEKVRLSMMRDEIEMRLEGLDDDYEISEGHTLASINNEEFLDNAAEQLLRYLDNFDGEEVWGIVYDCANAVNKEE